MPPMGSGLFGNRRSQQCRSLHVTGTKQRSFAWRKTRWNSFSKLCRPSVQMVLKFWFSAESGLL